MAATALRFYRPARTLTESIYDLDWDSPAASSAALTQHSREFIIPSGESTRQFVVTTSELPRWLEPALAGFSALLSLRENWDSYGGRKTSDELIVQALDVLTHIMELNSPVPSVVPLGDGGLQLEWHRKQQDLEIVFHLDAVPTFFYQNRRTQKEREGFATDAVVLAAVFANIA